jgi:hypothetical protein
MRAFTAMACGAGGFWFFTLETAEVEGVSPSVAMCGHALVAFGGAAAICWFVWSLLAGKAAEDAGRKAEDAQRERRRLVRKIRKSAYQDAQHQLAARTDVLHSQLVRFMNTPTNPTERAEIGRKAPFLAAVEAEFTMPPITSADIQVVVDEEVDDDAR